VCKLAPQRFSACGVGVASPLTALSLHRPQLWQPMRFIRAQPMSCEQRLSSSGGAAFFPACRYYSFAVGFIGVAFKKGSGYSGFTAGLGSPKETKGPKLVTSTGPSGCTKSELRTLERLRLSVGTRRGHKPLTSTAVPPPSHRAVMPSSSCPPHAHARWSLLRLLSSAQRRRGAAASACFV
jgi:hypothetical protein